MIQVRTVEVSSRRTPHMLRPAPRRSNMDFVCVRVPLETADWYQRCARLYPSVAPASSVREICYVTYFIFHAYRAENTRAHTSLREPAQRQETEFHVAGACRTLGSCCPSSSTEPDVDNTTSLVDFRRNRSFSRQ